MNHIERRHTIRIALPIARAFPLFTPRGEMEWIDDWRPTFIHPADGETQDGMVFTTGAGGEETLWGCVAWEPEKHRVRYARVTPGNRFGYVTVTCRALGPDETEVNVGYDFTALSPAGEHHLAQVTEEAFAASIEEWRGMIAARITA